MPQFNHLLSFFLLLGKHSISCVRRQFLLFVHPTEIIKAISYLSTGTNEISSTDLILWLVVLWSPRKTLRLKLFVVFVPELFPVVASLMCRFVSQPVPLQGYVLEFSPLHQKSLLTIPMGTVYLTPKLNSSKANRSESD